MARYKHWGYRYDPISENICSEPGCTREATDYEAGRVKCARHLGNALELINAPSRSQVRAVRRLG